MIDKETLWAGSPVPVNTLIYYTPKEKQNER
jgi:hypothetical protein